MTIKNKIINTYKTKATTTTILFPNHNVTLPDWKENSLTRLKHK